MTFLSLESFVAFVVFRRTLHVLWGPSQSKPHLGGSPPSTLLTWYATQVNGLMSLKNAAGSHIFPPSHIWDYKQCDLLMSPIL